MQCWLNSKSTQLPPLMMQLRKLELVWHCLFAFTAPQYVAHLSETFFRFTAPMNYYAKMLLRIFNNVLENLKSYFDSWILTFSRRWRLLGACCANWLKGSAFQDYLDDLTFLTLGSFYTTVENPYKSMYVSTLISGNHWYFFKTFSGPSGKYLSSVANIDQGIQSFEDARLARGGWHFISCGAYLNPNQ